MRQNFRINYEKYKVLVVFSSQNTEVFDNLYPKTFVAFFTIIRLCVDRQPYFPKSQIQKREAKRKQREKRSQIQKREGKRKRETKK